MKKSVACQAVRRVRSRVLTIGMAGIMLGMGITVISAFSAGNASASTSSSESAQSSKLATCETAANAGVKLASKPLQITTPTPSFDIKKLAGKTIWFVSPSQSFAFLVAQSEGVVEAAKAAGMKVHIFDGQGSLALQNQGMQEAVDQHAGGIIDMDGLPSLFSGPIANAKKAGIPVVSFGNDSADPSLGIGANITDSGMVVGEDLAYFILQQTHCEPGPVPIFYSNDSGEVTATAHGAEAVLNKYCVKCHLIIEGQPSPTMEADATSLTGTILQEYPGIKYMIAGADSTASSMVEGVEIAKKNVHVVGLMGTEANLQYLVQDHGAIENAEVAWPPPQQSGWLIVDDLARLMEGLKPIPDTLPLQLLDLKDLPSTASRDTVVAALPETADYQTVFERAWEIKK